MNLSAVMQCSTRTRMESILRLLKRQWLRELGFEENTSIVVHCEDGILTITRADAEADYLDVPEGAAICVAEPKTKYGRASA